MKKIILNKILIPTYYYKSVEDIEVDKIKKLGFKYILCDLDNTLTGFHKFYIGKKGQKFIDECKKYNIEIIAISNNNYRRCKRFSAPLNMKFLSHADKPFTIKLDIFLKALKINKKDCIFIGDQIYTDIKCANFMKIKSILVEPLTSKDLILTAINRLRDKKIRNYMRSNNMLNPIE